MRFIKDTIKNIIAYSIYYTGAYLLLKRIKLHGKILVMTYHRVLPKKEALISFSNTGIIVYPDTFNKHLEFIKKHFKIISINDMEKCIQSDNKYSCVITFDDGWFDNYEYAFPIIKKHGVKPVIFLPVDYIGTDRLFWQERLGKLLSALIKSDEKGKNELANKIDFKLPQTTDVVSIKAHILQYISNLKKQPYSRINDVIDTLSNAIPAAEKTESIDRYMNWEQVSEMHQHGVDFGSHACSHRILPRLSETEIEEELSRSASVIAEKLGQQPISIAYPNGDTSSTVEITAKYCGYKLGFTTRRGYVDRPDNHQSLNRIDVHENSACNNPRLMMALLGYF